MTAYRIVLTGGPGAGKSTVINAIEQKFKKQILVMPEAASQVIEQGEPSFIHEYPSKDLDHFRDAIRQNSIRVVQNILEKFFLKQANRSMADVIVYDRGILDGAPYYGRGLDGFLNDFNLDLQEVYSRYDLIIHMESLAVSDPKKYEQLLHTNPARFEDAVSAANTDKEIKRIWAGHPNVIFFESKLGIEKLTTSVIGLVSKYVI